MQLIDYFFCDDIRFEIRGKHSAIGMYRDSINFESKDPSKMPWPVELRLGVFLRLLLEDKSKYKGENKFTLLVHLDSEQLLKTDGTLKIDGSAADFTPGPGVISMPLGPYPFPITGTGTLSVALTITPEDGDPIILDAPFTMPVRVRLVK